MKKGILALLFSGVFLTASAQSGHVVISQVFGGGGTAGAPYTHDYVELFNAASAPVSLAGWSLQYEAAAGGGPWSVVPLTGSIPVGGYFLVSLATTGTAGVALPLPDLSYSSVNLNAAGGKLALVRNQQALQGACSTKGVEDLVGYGATTCAEAAPAPEASGLQALVRAGGGCIDTDSNAHDFTVQAPQPHNSQVPIRSCRSLNAGSALIATSITQPLCITGIRSAVGTIGFESIGVFPDDTFDVWLSNPGGIFTTEMVKIGSYPVNGTDPSGLIPFTIPAGTTGSIGYKMRIRSRKTGIYTLSGPYLEIINGLPEVSSFTGTVGPASTTLSWQLPASCFDEILVVSKAGNPPTVQPTGDGASYVGSTDFTSSPILGDSRVLYKGSGTAVVITGLTTGTTYYFKAFTRLDNQWSSGVEFKLLPRYVPQPGDVLINQFSPGYGAASDEYVELINTTNKSFDLSDLAIRYQSVAGVRGFAGGPLSGTLLPNHYWLLSPNGQLTVGQTRGLPRDGAIIAGMVATGGQLGLVRMADNVVIDAVAYGPVISGDYREGEPADTPPTDGGLRRKAEKQDRNNNQLDFTTVPNSAIRLHNSSDNSPLPVLTVSLSKPSGTGSQLLVLQNTIENDIRYYEVQRAANGTSFQPLQQLVPANTGQQALYTLRDSSQPQGVLVYRVKIVTLGNEIQYSNMVSITAGSSAGFSIYPNPVFRNRMLSIQGLARKDYLLQIIDGSGVVIKKQAITSAGPFDAKTISLNGLLPGIYWVQVIGGEQWYQQKLILQ